MNEGDIMKVRAKDVGKFKPVTIELTLETVDELETFYSAMNHAAICDALLGVGGIETGYIRAALESGGYVDYQNKFKEFSDKLANAPCMNRDKQKGE
jgi:hypothetical protein